MRYFFGLKPKQLFTFADLEVDMHSHLIPGIDDGAKSLADSLTLIRNLQTLGYRKIITTPHIIGHYFPNTPDIIYRGRDQVREALVKENLEIEFQAAAEYFVDDFFIDLLKRREPLLSFSDRKVLIEVSMLAKNNQLFDVVFQLLSKQYTPILAHPERYLFYANEFEIFHQLREKGCKLQVNILSLVGHYGKQQKALAVRLLKEDLIDYLGTDLHHQGHLSCLRKSQDQAFSSKIVGRQNFLES